MNLEELCALRDKLVMDPNLSKKEQEYLFGFLTEKILDARN